MIRNNVTKSLGGEMELPAADNYLIELAEAWRECHRLLVPGGRLEGIVVKLR
jgi:hypothetical protein